MTPKNSMKNTIRIIKGIAKRAMLVNGKPSPCHCSDRITCAYCVQASLLSQETKYQLDKKAKDGIIAVIRREGVRKTAIRFSVNHNAVRHWIKTGNIPHEVIEKYAGLGQR